METILKVPIKKISFPTTQRTIDILLESKGVRLDVYVDDTENTIFNAEMEVEYMTLFQRDMENRELGREETLKCFIRNMLNRGMTDDDICELAECSKDLIDEVRNS